MILTPQYLKQSRRNLVAGTLSPLSSCSHYIATPPFCGIAQDVSGWAIGTFTDDPRPWVDAISFAISLTAGVICFLRFNNQYVWWIASGLAQMVLWFISFRQGSATLAMFINSSIYLMNDVLAFTISPWYNAKERQRLIKQEAIYATEVAHAH